jgi:16S rRNA (uracil1498-N3)-methyltransferase
MSAEMSGRPPRHAPLVFVDDIDGLGLERGDAHHLGRVLRIRAGEDVTAADGAGAWRPCRWTGDGLEAAGEPRHEVVAEPAVTVALAPTKGERPAWAVQKLTEIGVDRIVIVTAERSVVRWDAGRAGTHLDRLARVAREAAAQSRRAAIPPVVGPVPVAEMVASGAALAEPGGPPLSLRHPSVVVGPEGGWAPDELRGAPTAGLGTTILRTETAAVVAASLLVALRNGYIVVEE